MLRKLKMGLWLILLFFVVGKVNAMPYEEEYNISKFTNVDSDKVYKVINAYDDNGVVDGYIGVGAASSGKSSKGLVVKYDADFNITKSVSYDCNCTFSTIIPSFSKEGIVDGYIVTSNLGESVLLIKYDLNLEVVSEVSNEGSEVALNNVEYSYDENGNVDGYIYLAEVFSFSSYSIDALVYKYDLNLNFIWKNSVASNYADAYSGVVPSYKDGKIDGYIFTGYTDNNSETEFIQKTDLNGNVIWTKNILLEENRYSVTDVTLAYENNEPVGLIVVAKSSNISVDTEYGVIAKISFDGEIEKLHYVTTLVNSGFEQIIPNMNKNGKIDGYIVAGYIDFKAYKDDAKSLLMLEINNNLDVEWYNIADGFRYYKELMYSYNENGIIDGLFTITCSGAGLNEGESAKKYRFKEYKITTNAIHGDISSSLEIAKEGEMVTFKTTGEDNYKLLSIKVTTASGKVIEVIDNSFVMPDEDVNIEVVYELISQSNVENPNTIALSILLPVIALLLSVVIRRNLKRRYS